MKSQLNDIFSRYAWTRQRIDACGVFNHWILSS